MVISINSFSRQPVVYVFDPLKAFNAQPDFVYIAGTLTGSGIAYRFNTVQITCYKDRNLCLTNSIEGISSQFCQLSRLDSPLELAIDRWDENEVQARNSGRCSKTTITINLKSEAALWVEEPQGKYDTSCAHTDAQTYRWTIEKPDSFHPQPKGRLDD